MLATLGKLVRQAGEPDAHDGRRHSNYRRLAAVALAQRLVRELACGEEAR